MKLSEKIKKFRGEILDEIKGKVYKFSNECNKEIKKQTPDYDCTCSFTLVETDKNDLSLTELEVRLRPYSVCEACKTKMTRPIGVIKGVVEAIENGNLEVEAMDTVKKVEKE